MISKNVVLSKDDFFRLLQRSSWVVATLLFVYHCVYDPEPSLHCSPEEAILTPEQVTAFVMKQWPGVQEGEPREKFLSPLMSYIKKLTRALHIPVNKKTGLI